jgi:hypothetical protein
MMDDEDDLLEWPDSDSSSKNGEDADGESEEQDAASEEDGPVSRKGKVTEDGVRPRGQMVDSPTRDVIQEGPNPLQDSGESVSRRGEPKTDFDGVQQTDAETLRSQHFGPSPTKKRDDGLDPTEDGWSGPDTNLKFDAPETNLELLQQVDEFLDGIDEDLPTARERARAGDHYKVSDRFGQETTTQSKLSFDYVRNDGIIVHGDDYYGLQKVKPTRWESKDYEGQMDILRAYVAFLKALQWEIAIPCYPKAFEFEKYLQNIHEAGVEAAAQGAHPILDFGRRYHILWTDKEIDPDKIKKKEFYIVVRVDKERVSRGLRGLRGESFFSLIAGRILDRFKDIDEDELEEACLEAIKQRQQTMKAELTKTGVEVEQITDRQKSMEMLYHYYNHVEPVLDKFEDGTITQADFSKVGE